jgi:hypothetical protein
MQFIEYFHSLRTDCESIQKIYLKIILSFFKLLNFWLSLEYKPRFVLQKN